MPGQDRVGLRGIDRAPNDAGAFRIQAKKARLQAGRDKLLVKPEREIVVNGHASVGSGAECTTAGAPPIFISGRLPADRAGEKG